MRKIHILAAILAVFAFGAITATSALAVVHEWLTLGGARLARAENATTDGTILLLITRIPALFGGGSIDILCMGQFLGTVGPGARDTITLFENLEAREQDKLKCEVSESSNSVCRRGTLVIVEPDNLPWQTELTLIAAGPLFDNIVALTGGKLVGYITECGSIRNLCGVSLELSRFIKNVAAGAEFAFEEIERATCTIGGGLAKGTGTVLGFLAN